MSREPGQRYLASDVLTATPVRLRLMLIEGAIRFATQAKQAWQAGADAEALLALGRAREIAAELYSSAAAAKTPLGRQIASVYLFLFRTLAEAGLHRDTGRVEEALRVLRSELDTWRQLAGVRGDPGQASLRHDAAESSRGPLAGPQPGQASRISLEA